MQLELFEMVDEGYLGLAATYCAVTVGAGIGSFTTFSTWILDSDRLGAAGQAPLAWLNIALSITAGLAAVTLGHWLATTL